MVHKVDKKLMKEGKSGIHKVGTHKAGSIPTDNPRPDPKKFHYWTLGVKEIGYVYFKHFPSAFGQRIFKEEERVKPRYFCPVHHNVELQYNPASYYCPECKKGYVYQQVEKRFPEEKKGMTPAEIRDKYPRTEETALESVVPITNISPEQMNTSLSYYLIPINTYENMLNYNQFVHLLMENKLAGVTPDMRIVSGLTSHKFLVVPSKSKQCLAMMEYLPERTLVPVPEEAKFKEPMLTPQMKKETEVAQKILMKVRVGE